MNNLPSQNNVTSVKLSDLNKFPNAVAKLLPKLFHLRQNCCCESIPDVDWNVFAEKLDECQFNYIL